MLTCAIKTLSVRPAASTVTIHFQLPTQTRAFQATHLGAWAHFSSAPHNTLSSVDDHPRFHRLWFTRPAFITSPHPLIAAAFLCILPNRSHFVAHNAAPRPRTTPHRTTLIVHRRTSPTGRAVHNAWLTEAELGGRRAGGGPRAGAGLGLAGISGGPAGGPGLDRPCHTAEVLWKLHAQAQDF